MQVLKRNGTYEAIDFNKVLNRIQRAAKFLTLEHITVDELAQKVIAGIYDGMSSRDIDELTASLAAEYMLYHPSYNTLAARILISRHQKEVDHDLERMVAEGLITQKLADDWEALGGYCFIQEKRDFLFDYFGFCTLRGTQDKPSYLLKYQDGTYAETPQHMYLRVALALFGQNEAKVDESYFYQSNHYFTMASPTLFNAGTPCGQLASCFLQAIESDSLDGIFKGVGDVARISKSGGGIGFHVSNIRSKGSLIKGTGGTSDGLVPMLRVFNETARYVNQGGRRKGAFAVYLEPWHADIEGFLELRLNQGKEENRTRDLFTALWVPDLFMKQVENNGEWFLFDPNVVPLSEYHGAMFEEEYWKAVDAGLYEKSMPARDLMMMAARSMIETGAPYFLFKDTANRDNPQSALGTIKSSNLCVAPETLILTRLGHTPIATLENQEVEVWNGKEFSKVTVKKTGTNQRLLRVITDSGQELDCTPEHHFYVKNVYHAAPKKVCAKDLQPGDKLIRLETPVIESPNEVDLRHAYSQGFYSGDGCFVKPKYGKPYPRIYLYGEKVRCLDFLSGYKRAYPQDKQDRIVVDYDGNIEDSLFGFDKSFVPGVGFTVSSRLLWLAGLIDSDGTLTDNDGSQGVQISSVDKEFLKEVQLMLQTLGVASKIKLLHEEGVRLLPANDGTGELKEYHCSTSYRLLISANGCYSLYKLGLPTQRVVLNGKKPNREASRLVQVDNVICLDRVDDTFCFTEPLEGKGVFNGLLTGQCAEIVEYSDANQTAVCNLGSMNLQMFHYDREGFIDAIAFLTESLDKVIDVTVYPDWKTERSNKFLRPIGIGIQGLDNLLQLQGVSWESDRARVLNMAVMSIINEVAHDRSVSLGAEKGVPDGCKQIGLERRNSLITALMPTASTSQMLGNIESFEPRQSNLFLRRTQFGEFYVLNEYLVQELEALGMWNSLVANSIKQNHGSVQHIEIPQELKDRFKTVWELSPELLIDMAAERQPFVDQSQSMNLYYPEPSTKRVIQCLGRGWKKGLVTGSYYTRTPVARDAYSASDCDSCSG